jgi:endonuclease/exonuclease/phosphatase family metal-dependent hydrolase
MSSKSAIRNPQSEIPIRLVTWNIEKGKQWELLEKCLQAASIRSADLLCLNEVDDGMARSGNRRIAYEIAERLDMQVAFGPTFKEFTKGIGDELLAPGENTTALQGNATLSRFPILEVNNLRLPSGFDHSKREEKREGDRHALVVRVDCRGRPVTVANAHLEVFSTSRSRQRQMKLLLSQIGPGAAIITGDFNSNTFNRGNAFHTFQSLAYLLRSDVKTRALSPWLHEPLFQDLRAAGFSWEPFNDAVATCSVDLSTLEDRFYVPRPIRTRVLDRCRILPLRLDFITCRGLRALSGGRTITDLPCHPSDHLPITCDLDFE